MQEYNHSQTSSSSTWTVSHDLNTDAVTVDVFINNGPNLEKILPLDVVKTSNNVLTITFSSAQTGKVRVVGSTGA